MQACLLLFYVSGDTFRRVREQVSLSAHVIGDGTKWMQGTSDDTIPMYYRGGGRYVFNKTIGIQEDFPRGGDG